MKKILLFLCALIGTMGSFVAKAQTQHNVDNYNAAKSAITDGETYRIKTTVSGTDYYVTTTGTLTNVKDDAGFFTITKTSGGNYGTGFRIYTGAGVFTNPPLSNNVANLYPGSYAISTGNDRTDWERQILYLNGEGKYAIRSCNCADGTSSWNDAARTHWTYSLVEDVPTPCYSYTAEYIWDFEVPPTIINVTYKLYESDGTTLVNSASKQQEANSEPSVPTSLLNNYIYSYDVTGTIGSTDSEITVVRTFKSGIVHALDELIDNKAYVVRCDRGAFLTKNGYLASTAHGSLTTAEPSNFAVISYEDNRYLYSVVDKKFVTYSGALETMPIHDTEDALQLTAQADPYFLGYFTYGETPTNYGINTNGNDPYGYVINTWMNADPGNKYFFIEAGDFDPTEALEALENYFHPSYYVTYVVKDTAGNVLFTSDPIPTMLGEHITTLPADYQRQFYNYNEVDVTISEQNTNVEFTATWNGPFKLSTDFANAQWQNMAMRGTWYVTNGVKDGDGAYKTQNANTMGLVEDSYQWAFIAIGYGEGIKIINKAAGDGKSFGWTDDNQKDTGIPTIMDDGEGNHVWKIVSSTNGSVPAGSFCLNVPGTNLYINQYGGAGGSVKFWNSGNNVSDAGSAFTVFDVPTNFASYVSDEIAPYFESTAKYFVLTDVAEAAIGYDESYKTECPFDTYKSMKEALTTALADITSFKLPETGFYTMKNKNYGTYMGIDPSDKNLYGNYESANNAKHIIYLNKTGAGTYEISLEGVFAPASVGQSAQVKASDEAATYTVSVPTVGYAAFKATNDQYSALHCAGGGSIVGWEIVAAASQWAIEDAVSIELTIGEAGYATTYLPFPVDVPEHVKAYTVSGFNEKNQLILEQISNTIPSYTPVILEGAANTYTFNIVEDVDPIDSNELTGTFLKIAAPNESYILQNLNGYVGFYKVDTNEATPNIPANRAYFAAPSSVKAFFFGGETAIKSVFDGVAAGEIYDLNGAKAEKMQKGKAYIVNGTTVIVK